MATREQIHIGPGCLDDPDVRVLLSEHIAEARGLAPPGSSHTLDIDLLRQPHISFLVARIDGSVAGCGALMRLDGTHAEIKSMRTAPRFRRRGVARLLLEQLVAQARSAGYLRISLDTGADEHFAPARALYRSAGFRECGPFADYREDPYKTFMTLEL